MIRGVLIAFGVMLLLAPVPLAQALGPFVGGYVGISRAGSGGSCAAKGLLFGTLLGLLALLVSAAAATALMLTLDLNLALLWLAVGAFTLYTGNLGALGAIYRLLRTQRDRGVQLGLRAAFHPHPKPSPFKGEGTLGVAFLTPASTPSNILPRSP